MSMKTISEMELKFFLTTEQDLVHLGTIILDYIEENQWFVLSDENVVKEIIYYDTPDYRFAKEGSTLRRVKDPKRFNTSKRYRYDFKRGEGDSRIERTSWQSRALDVRQLREIFYIQESIKESGRALKKSRKITFSPVNIDDYGKEGSFQVETSIDEIINIDSITVLKELEFELKKGDPGILECLHADFTDMGYKSHTTQKYTQLISF